MPTKPSPDRPRSGPAPSGTAPGVLIDDLAAERNSPPLPPEPIFTIDLVEAESGKRGRRYVAELEEHASRNARAASEARRIALEQRHHLEEAARGRLAAEREISKLQRELRVAAAEQQRLAARRKMPRPSAAPAAPVELPRGAAKSELTRTREIVEQQQRLLGERRDQLVHALRERDEARLEARRATDACGRAERKLGRATEMLQQNALDETARITAGSSTIDAVGENEMAVEHLAARSQLEARIENLTDELEHLTTHAVALEDALLQETGRADLAENRLAVQVIDVDTARSEVAAVRQELADARDREATALAMSSELTTQLQTVEAAAATTTAEQHVASIRVAELERQLATSLDERDTATTRTVELERQLATSLDERDTATTGLTELDAQLTVVADERDDVRARLADLERAATARHADDAFAALHVAELTERLADLEATARKTEVERDTTAAHAHELEALLADATDDRDTITARAHELEALLTTIADELEAARSQLADVERAVTARETDDARAALQLAELTEQLADLEAATATAKAERDAALAHTAETEQALTAAAAAPDGDAMDYVDELEARLVRAEQDAAAVVTRIDELTRAANEADAARTAVEDGRAADRLAAEVQLETLRGRVAELEAMILVVESTPVAPSARALALDELGYLAAPDSDREPTPAEQPQPMPAAVPGAVGEQVDQSELRRSLLASLSDLAHEPVHRIEP